MATLRIILGDQLSHDLPILRDVGPDDRILMMEVAGEATHVPQHPKKLVLILSAMRHFAEELARRGCTVDYIDLESPASRPSFTATLSEYLATRSFDRLRLTTPSEYRVRQEVLGWESRFDSPVHIDSDPRFVVTPDEFAAWADGRKQLVMEAFYRRVRQQTGLLMDGRDPVGGRWNYDRDNRKPAAADHCFPEPFQVSPDATTRRVIDIVGARFGEHFGEIDPFWFAVTATQAKAAAQHFFDVALPMFGDYQDAMRDDSAFLYHSVLSHYLNLGLLDPLALCRQAEQCYRDGHAPINAVEGFVRQIIGWREFIRGIYWLHMPAYADSNFFAADAKLPAAYWGAETDLACVAAVVQQTRDNAYSHHIQRLMVTGNLALLIGVAPAEVHRWYLAVYADAYEWVEMPNTLGMATFADGGIVGTKPYAASGAYINKMSNYCGSCRYDVRQKTGANACPFNYLYWDFLIRNETRLASNRRMGLIYAQLRKMPPERRAALVADAAHFRATFLAGHAS